MSNHQRALYVAQLLDADRLAHDLEDAKPRLARTDPPMLTDEQMAAVDDTAGLEP